MSAAILPSDDDVQSYWKQGYWIAPVLFDAERIRQARHAIERIYSGDLEGEGAWPYVGPVNTDQPDAVKTALFASRVNDFIRSLIADPAVVRIAAALMRVDRVRLWQDQAIWKPGNTGSTEVANIGYHQDYAYWRDSSTTNMLSANIALQDTTLNNGALRLFAGSHKCGVIDDADGFFDTGLDRLRQRFAAQTEIAEETVIDLQAGQVSFHHSLTIHGSGPNTSAEPRLVIAPGYMPDGTFYERRSEGQLPTPHSEFLGADRPYGTPYAGNAFPLVYDAAEDGAVAG